MTVISSLLLSLVAFVSSSRQDPTITLDVLTPRGEWVSAIVSEDKKIRSAEKVDVGQDALAWIPIYDNTDRTDRPPFSMIRLADGQTIVGLFGRFHGALPDTVVRWKHPMLGSIDIPTDRVAFIQIQPMAHPPCAIESDEIVMINGDRIGGFIEKFSDPIVLEHAGSKQEIPLDRIAGLALVTAKTTPAKVRVWMSDESVIDGKSISPLFGDAFALQGVSFVKARPSISLPTEEIAGVAQALARLMPLALLVPKVAPPTASTLPRAEYPQPTIHARDTTLGAATIEIRGPERLIYEIPQGFSVFSALVEISSLAPAWTDCVFVIRQGAIELARQPMSAKFPKVKIGVAIKPGPLEIEIEDSGGGPIGDIVILRRALLIAAEQ